MFIAHKQQIAMHIVVRLLNFYICIEGFRYHIWEIYLTLTFVFSFFFFFFVILGVVFMFVFEKHFFLLAILSLTKSLAHDSVHVKHHQALLNTRESHINF